MDAITIGLSALLAPATLFFLLGFASGLARSDLAVPEQVSRTIALFLMLCIGFKGGVEARQAGLDGPFIATAVAGVLIGLGLPVAVFHAARRLRGVDRATAAAVAACYGSVSVVTFAAAQQLIAAQDLKASGFMTAVLALMETPAILSALLISRLAPGEGARTAKPIAAILHEVFFSGALLLLAGSFAIGLVTGPAGMAKLDVFVGPLFQGVLCLFLLDMGLVASRGLMGQRGLSGGLIGLGLLTPLAGAGLGLGAAVLIGLSPADGALLMTLCGSASYIAAPAAMKVALPQARSGVYTTLALGVTFPFNLLAGIPLYAWAAGVFLSG